MKQSRALAASIAVATAFVFAPAAGSAQEQQAPPPPLAGAYTLAQVDDADLPTPIGEEAGCSREITAATLTLKPDNQWELEANVRETCGEAVAEKVAKQQGTYSAMDQTVTFVVAPAIDATETTVPTIEIDALKSATVNEGALIAQLGDATTKFVFRR
jgi:hypothetical protein